MPLLVIAARNAQTLAHPVDDLHAVLENPDGEYRKYGDGVIEDSRLPMFIKPSVVALIAAMSPYYNEPYQIILSHVLTLNVLDYLAAHGRTLASYGYDDAYNTIQYVLSV